MTTSSLNATSLVFTPSTAQLWVWNNKQVTLWKWEASFGRYNKLVANSQWARSSGHRQNNPSVAKDQLCISNLALPSSPFLCIFYFDKELGPSSAATFLEMQSTACTLSPTLDCRVLSEINSWQHDHNMARATVSLGQALCMSRMCVTLDQLQFSCRKMQPAMHPNHITLVMCLHQSHQKT